MEYSERFKINIDGRTARISVDNMLINANRFGFWQTARELLETNIKILVVDFDGCRYIDSSGLGALVSLRKRAVQAAKTLLLEHLSEDLLTLFELTQLNVLLEVAPPHEFERQCAVLVPNFNAVNNELLEYLAHNPHGLSRLNWRDFELLLDAVFRNNGFRTEIGPGRADGGIDIRLLQSDTCGEILTLVQAKKYRGDRPIRLEAVQAFSAVVEDEKANRGLFVTTSRYLPSAKKFAERQRHRLTLADSTDVAKWCEIALRSRR